MEKNADTRCQYYHLCMLGLLRFQTLIYLNKEAKDFLILISLKQ